MKLKIWAPSLQTKITLVLVGVIVPTALIVTVVQNGWIRSVIQDESRQLGITAAKSLATEISSQRLLSASEPASAVQTYVQQFLYNQPNIIRVDVVVRDAKSGLPRAIASSVEEEGSDPDSPGTVLPLVEAPTSRFREDEEGVGTWEIAVPIEAVRREPKVPPRLLGAVHLVVSMKLLSQASAGIFRVSVLAALVSVVVLLGALTFFLRRTIGNEKLLRVAESRNLVLTEQLFDAQRQLLNLEKLAVMGQLTASFAHEIGTPLNAIGGHLQLLREEVSPEPRERIGIIESQVQRIAGIVKGFLQSTGQPNAQAQLVDLNSMVERACRLIQPQTEALGILLRQELDRTLPQVRIVPVDVEQILLNLVNNSLDSMRDRKARKPNDPTPLKLFLQTDTVREGEERFVRIQVRDSGMGISQEDLSQVWKPFFTTKRPGEGTGLGLTICQQLARKHGASLDIDSQEGSGTRVSLKIPT